MSATTCPWTRGDAQLVAVPHAEQNFAPGVRGVSHLLHVEECRVPQLGQNLASGGSFDWHLPQVAPWGVPQCWQKAASAGMDCEHFTHTA